MNDKQENLDRLLDRTIDQIRDETPRDHTVNQAAERVWVQLQEAIECEAAKDPAVRPIRTCEDYRDMLPAYLDNRLSEARKLLLEDHSRECFTCRKALKEARAAMSEKSSAAPKTGTRTKSTWRSDLSWAVAATLIIGVALVGVAFKSEIFNFSTGGWLQIDAVDGALLEVKDTDIIPVAVGQTLEDGEWIRTTKESGAVFTLDDGSKVEMDERSELYVTREGRNNTIHLARGGIIVQAADQGAGHLFVDTEDCTVSVTGTVFSVSHGTKGSRISVIEGEVIVDQNGDEQILHPGQQVTTRTRLAHIPVESHIAWSRNSDMHLAMLHELASFRTELEKRLPDTKLRYDTRLLDSVPENTVFFAAIPNMTADLAEAHRLLQEKVQSSGPLNAWWKENVVANGIEPEIDRVMEKIQRLGDQLGDEIVMAMAKKPDNPNEPCLKMNMPVFLAELKNPDAFRNYLLEDLAEIGKAAGEIPPLGLVDDPFSFTWNDSGTQHDALLFWINGNMLAVSPEIESLRHLASLAGSPEAGRFKGSKFHSRLAESYRNGAGILVGADLGAIIAGSTIRMDEPGVMDKLGINDIEHLVFERHEVADTNYTTASLSFSQERRGIAAWLAEPAPMGALGFISPDATAVAAFVVNNPASLLGETLDELIKADGQFEKELERFETEFGIDLVKDIAGPLGGEVAFALDGPLLPKPAWKLALEIYDPAALQRTIAWAVQEVNNLAAKEGQPGLTMTTVDRSGRTYYTLTADELGISVHYTFIDGYFIAAPQQELLNRAIQYRASGITLPNSGSFKSLLPRDGQENLSAVVYQNLGSILAPVVRQTIGRSKTLSPEQQAMIDDLTADSRPSLFCVYGERDRIDIIGVDRGGLLGSDIGNIFNLGSLMSLRESMASLPHEGGDTVYH